MQVFFQEKYTIFTKKLSIFVFGPEKLPPNQLLQNVLRTDFFACGSDCGAVQDFRYVSRGCCKTKRLNVANQQHPRQSRGAQVGAANGWEGSLLDKFRQTERKGSAEALS